MNRPKLAVLLLVLSTCPTITFAQEESPPNALQAILHTVRIGQRLRITTRDQLTIQGAYAGIREGHVVLVENGDHAVPLDEIDIIWRRTQRTREGAILGGMTGAAYGLWLCSVFGQEYSISARGYALNSGLFASIGALPGALLGAFVPKWQEIYRAPYRFQPTLVLGPCPSGTPSLTPSPTPNEPSPETPPPDATPTLRTYGAPRSPFTLAVHVGYGSVFEGRFSTCTGGQYEECTGGTISRVTLTREVAPKVDAGIEMTLQSYTRHYTSRGWTVTSEAIYEGTFVRVRPWNRSWQPYFDGGLALRINDDVRLYPTIGAGLLYRPNNHRFVYGLSGRYYPTMRSYGTFAVQLHAGLTY